VTYGGPTLGTGLATDKWIALVQQTQNAANTGQTNNPCRDANQVTIAVTSSGSNDARLHSGVLKAATGTKTVTIPQLHSTVASVHNYLDPSETFAVCYAEVSGSNTDLSWRDSYIRVRLTKLFTISASGVFVDTVGTFGNVPSLEVRWTGSLSYQQWIRFTSADVNSGEPCDKSQHALTSSDTSTNKVQSGAASMMVTLDTSMLAATAKNQHFFAVCYAENDGSGTDVSWRDSGIRLRFIRWTNSEKKRVVSGAPMRLTFSINMGLFDTSNDRIALMRNAVDCNNAHLAPFYSDGSKMIRRPDYSCTSVNASSAKLTCDSNFDGVYSERCTVGSLCDPSNPSNGGCGDGSGQCVGTIQLPSDASYDAVWDAQVHQETRLGEGFYAICICLGGSNTNAISAPTPTPPARGSNGDGGCDEASEFTRVFSNYANPPASQTLSVISKPRLGRVLEANGTAKELIRHVANRSFTYQIKAATTTAGYQVVNGDSIFFAPLAMGCSHFTKYSGPGTHIYDHGTNAYISSGVDRRWRTIAKKVCITVGPDATTSCDTNFDGLYTETCARHAYCDPSNPLNGGCGGVGMCGSPIGYGTNHSFDRTGPIQVDNYNAGTLAAQVTTPNTIKLTTVQHMAICFATAESLLGDPTDVTDYVQLQDDLEVINPPRLGPIASPGHVRALERSSPKFTVNTMKYGDLLYFVPKLQPNANAEATTDDCLPDICTLVGASNVGLCDATYNGDFTDACVVGARCRPGQGHNGGCGAGGLCAKRIPTIHTSLYTGLLTGTNFNALTATGQIELPTSPQLIVSPLIPGIVSWHLATCLIPAGALQTLVDNVVPLQDMLSIFKEPTDSLVTSWFQYNVQELRFTDPQDLVYHSAANEGGYGTATFTAGYPGDIIVLKKDSCTDVHAITADHYAIGVEYSAKIVLEEAGGLTVGDQKGGTAGIIPLATGKVNELQPGIYKICYATKNSEGEDQADFKMLAKTLEILPPTATRPQLTIPRTVLLGQDLVIHWSSNIQLQDQLSIPNSWIGLYGAGECTAHSTEGTAPHECYKAFQFIETGVTSGTIIFSLADYKIAGEYDLRYFVGDTRNGQGRSCTGLTSVDHETYVTCKLVPSVVSSSVHIHGPDMRESEDMDQIVGLEVIFAGNRGRFN